MHCIDTKSTDEELKSFVLAVKANNPSDPALAARLAEMLAESGFQIKPKANFSADVASTGGPSSLSTLLCPLYLRVAGAVVPKLGVPGRPAGGVDSLLQIGGYRSSFQEPDIEHLLDQHGYLHFLAGESLTPLDAHVFRLRQELDAQAVPTLVAASLLSKKLALGVRRAGLDIRVAPHGNFGSTWEDATKNAKLFIEASRLLDIDSFPVLTDGQYPYQPFIGRRESLLALHHIFSGTASQWLVQHCEVCRTLAIACTPTEERERAATATAHDLRDAFYQNLEAQGSTAETFQALVTATQAEHTHVLCASNDGFAEYSLTGIRQVLVAHQKRAIQPERDFPDPAGLVLLRRPGDWVRRGEALATARIETERPAAVLHELQRHICMTSPRPAGTSFEGIKSDG